MEPPPHVCELRGLDWIRLARPNSLILDWFLCYSVYIGTNYCQELLWQVSLLLVAAIDLTKHSDFPWYLTNILLHSYNLNDEIFWKISVLVTCNIICLFFIIIIITVSDCIYRAKYNPILICILQNKYTCVYTSRLRTNMYIDKILCYCSNL